MKPGEGGAMVQVLLVVLVACCSLSPALAAAQHAPVSGPGPEPAPAWLTAWSPLRSVTDLSRGLPGTTLTLPGLLTTPAPRVGLFWTAGNPAALAAEVGEAWSGYRGEWSEADGEFRRPLDPGSEERTRLSAEGWRAVGERGGVAGRIVTDRLELGGPAFSELPDAFGSNPLVFLDTTGDAIGRTTTRIEGAGGLALGPVGLGVSLGFEAQETRTVESATPRAMRTAVPAVALGATWSVPGTDRLDVGVHGRWQRGTHWFNLYSVAAPNRIYQVIGYGEVRPNDVSGTFYRRETERESRAAGGELLARIAGGRVVLFAEVGETDESHWSLETNDPPKDTWLAEGLTVGAAADRLFLGGRLALHGAVTRSTLDGRSRLADLEDQVTFTADESRLGLSLDARLRLAAWTLGARTAGTYDSRVRVDSLEGMALDLRSWTTAGALEVARPIAAGFSAAAGLAVSVYRVGGSIPAPATIGDVYRDYIGPTLAVDATEAVSAAGSLTVLWSAPSGRSGFFVTGRVGSTSMFESNRMELAPGFDDARRGWSLVVGAALK